MFSLDLDLRSHTSSNDASAGPEGESDDNPIRLQGDTADEFRSLLWALYALYVFCDLSRLVASPKIMQASRADGGINAKSQ